MGWCRRWPTVRPRDTRGVARPSRARIASGSRHDGAGRGGHDAAGDQAAPGSADGQPGLVDAAAAASRRPGRPPPSPPPPRWRPRARCGVAVGAEPVGAQRPEDRRVDLLRCRRGSSGVEHVSVAAVWATVRATGSGTGSGTVSDTRLGHRLVGPAPRPGPAGGTRRTPGRGPARRTPPRARASGSGWASAVGIGIGLRLGRAAQGDRLVPDQLERGALVDGRCPARPCPRGLPPRGRRERLSRLQQRPTLAHPRSASLPMDEPGWRCGSPMTALMAASIGSSSSSAGASIAAGVCALGARPGSGDSSGGHQGHVALGGRLRLGCGCRRDEQDRAREDDRGGACRRGRCAPATR